MTRAIKKHRIKKLTKDRIEQLLPDLLIANSIDLSGRGIESILTFEGLTIITKLDLSSNRITKLPNLLPIKNATMLKLNNNKLRSESLTQLGLLRKLVTLNLSNNQIARLPKDSLRALNELKALILNDNMIQTLDWLPKLPALGSLILSHNRISELDIRVMLRLPNLIKLSLSHNQLAEIPDLSALPHLVELRLSHNKIQQVPSTLANNTCLKLLDIGHNAIDDWSGVEALSALEHLKQLNLRGNPIAGASQSMEDPDLKVSKVDEKTTVYIQAMKRVFPHLVIRDGERVRGKKTHGYEGGMKKRKAKQKTAASVDDTDGRDDAFPEQDVRDNMPEEAHAEAGNYSVKDPSDARKRVPASEETQVETSTTDNQLSIANIDTDGKNQFRADKKRKASNSVNQSKSDPASGVLQIRNLKKVANRKTTTTAQNEVNSTRVVSAETVGLGGDSAWD
uniref:Uncharacterized protein AlNc14C19G1953 n=1 Tax=Albugo laibachii Nc14 TaxID=890382 RepID=F0W4Y2_9STRA|nr:conserved hypothetical protein [Albugo laibachii Nc14]|eukprot:CCA16172.1 conserved hypothetical protein [Albugo laibachii Nc14]